MIDAPRLLKDLQRLLRELEEDLRSRVREVPELDAMLREQYREAKDAGRTGDAYEPWREEQLTQGAVAWILGCVFVRFLEDNNLVEMPRLSGPGERRQRALDQHEMYFRAPERRTHSDRDYLLDVFEQMAALPAAAPLFDRSHNPVWTIGLSGDGATRLLRFWQRVDPDTGALAHDFTDPEWNTRFLGDLYQDLSEAARKKYALLQTPEFVEEFILDRTLTPAIEEFGYQEVRLIDPTCGSGHFLLGAFHRLYELWVKHEPGTNSRALAQRALDQVYGVDLNPFAVAIARFRLLIAALRVSEIHSLRRDEAPAFKVNVTAGDSLLHGRRFDQLDLGSGADQIAGRPGIGHAFMAEDLDALNRILGQQYHAVVGNPPYITVKDKALNHLYREKYSACHMKYAMTVPFSQRFFDLAVTGIDRQPGGFVGMISANSFMKREFGKKLVEDFLPLIDLTHVVDTSGAYIPGHGTPTVMLFGRNRKPVAGAVRVAMGIKGEPATPEHPSLGLVWTAITSQLDFQCSESEYISVADVPRDSMGSHPWSIGGGGVAELRELLETSTTVKLGALSASIGFASFTGTDDAFVSDPGTLSRLGVPQDYIRVFVFGEALRDWSTSHELSALVPYRSNLEPVDYDSTAPWGRFLWPNRSTLGGVKSFGGKTRAECGDKWWTWYRWVAEKYRTPLSIAFAFVATHNHFVLDRGGKVFKQSAPVIKLPAGASEEEHLALLGLLNSSTACFWMKQVFHNKGGQGINEGIKSEKWEQFSEFTGTGLQRFPVPGEKPLTIAQTLDELAQRRESHLPAALTEIFPLSREEIDEHRKGADVTLGRMIALQEELDWRCYRLYGITERDLCHQDDTGTLLGPPELRLGERAFEIVMARQMASGELETTWFHRHGSTPITELPSHWPEDYRRLVEARMALVESDRNIGIIERPEYKRRWNQEPWEDQEARALRGWLLDRLETDRYWLDVTLQSTARLAEVAAADADFMQVATLYRDRPDFDVHALVAELVKDEAVPLLPALRYKPSGLRHREVWERTWALQRQEDAVDAAVEAELRLGEGESDEDYRSRVEKEQKRRKQAEIGDIPPPPKYRSADFLSSTFWRLRGPLDVPKERFVSYPHCSRDTDPSLVIAWAGWNHLQQAQALAAYYIAMKEAEGWSPQRLTPLLAGLLELIPWVKQWHNDLDPAHNLRMGDYFEGFVDEEARELGLTPDEIRAWTPPASTTRRGRKRNVAADG